jgi:hypothetical protein
MIQFQNPGTVIKWNTKAYKGSGTTKDLMSPEEEMELTMSLPGTTDYSKKLWTGTIDKSLATLFLKRLIEVRENVPFSLKDAEENPEEALSSLRILNSNAARVLFGDVGFRLVFFDKTNDISVNDQRLGLYRLLTDEMLQEIQEWCRRQSEGSFESFSTKALHETIANAVAHAAYLEQNGDIILEVHCDRIEISNLCFPEAAYFANRWFSKSHKTYNGILMESLRLVRAVDELGLGKTLIYSESIKSGRRSPEVYVEKAGRLNRWRTVLHGGKRDIKQLQLLGRLRQIYNNSEHKVMIATALVLWKDRPVSDLRQYIDGDSAPHFAEVLSDLNGPIFYFEKEDRIVPHRWVTVLLGEGKQSKALSQAEKEGLYQFACQLHSQYNDGYITPKELRKLAHMTDSQSERVLISKLLREWKQEGRIIRARRGTYRFTPTGSEYDAFPRILEQLRTSIKDGT